MSANGQDAIPGFPGSVLSIDSPGPAPAPAPATVESDFTEDLGDEITSEIAAGARREPAGSAPAVIRIVAADVAAHQTARATGGNILRDRYVLETQLGNGGTAMIYRAIDLRRDGTAADGRRVAIKLLRPELRDRPQNIARMQREFRQTQALTHPNVVRFHDLDCDRGSWFIIMELLTGETLGPRLRRSFPAGIPEPEAIRIAVAVGEALVHAHAHGVTHGDIKPDNIYLTTSGEVRLLDFGVAPELQMHSASAEPPAPVFAAATRVYASPEVLSGSAPEPRDDVFSLACVIYEMLTGLHPYGRRGADFAQRDRVVRVPIATLNATRWACLDSALDFTRAARPTMRELVHGLTRVQLPVAPAVVPAESGAATDAVKADSPQVVAPAVDVAERAGVVPAGAVSPSGPRRWLLTLAACGAAVLALALGLLIGRFNSAPVPVLTRQPAVPKEATIEAMSQSAALTDFARMAPAISGTPTVETPPQPDLPPGLVSFDSSRMIVSKRAVVAAIPLRHLNHEKLAVNVNWRVIDGTARAGLDYGGPLTGVETFVEGNTFRILYVPIVTSARATGDRTFTVELTGTSAGATVGTMRRIEVTILGDA